MRRLICALIALGMGAFFVQSAPAAIIMIGTPAGGSAGGQPVSSRVTFTTAADKVTILLDNLQADPRSIAQCLSGIEFKLSGGQNSATLASSFGTERIVNSSIYSDGGSAPAGWGLSMSNGSIKLSVLGTQEAPQHLIIGPPNASNKYGNANGSIVNDPHNPFLAQSATFILNVPGVTSATGISATTFQFNTAAGSSLSGVPEPGILGVTSLGLTLLIRSRRCANLAATAG